MLALVSSKLGNASGGGESLVAPELRDWLKRIGTAADLSPDSKPKAAAKPDARFLAYCIERPRFRQGGGYDFVMRVGTRQKDGGHPDFRVARGCRSLEAAECTWPARTWSSRRSIISDIGTCIYGMTCPSPVRVGRKSSMRFLRRIVLLQQQPGFSGSYRAGHLRPGPRPVSATWQMSDGWQRPPGVALRGSRFHHSPDPAAPLSGSRHGAMGFLKAICPIPFYRMAHGARDFRE